MDASSDVASSTIGRRRHTSSQNSGCSLPNSVGSQIISASTSNAKTRLRLRSASGESNDSPHGSVGKKHTFLRFFRHPDSMGSGGSRRSRTLSQSQVASRNRLSFDHERGLTWQQSTSDDSDIIPEFIDILPTCHVPGKTIEKHLGVASNMVYELM